MASPITQAILLIGGLGTRLRPLTYQRPKALLPLLNCPLISYEIRLFASHGVTDLIMAVSYGAGAIKDELGDGSRWGVRLHYVEDEQRLDTAGAIRNCAALIERPFFACNGDLVYDVDLTTMAAAHLRQSALVTFCLRRVDDISAYGLIQCDDGGRVRAFREKVNGDETGRNTVNSGFYAMDPQVLDYIPHNQPYSNETDLFPDLLARGEPLYGWTDTQPGYWSDVGRVETYLEAHVSLLHGAVSWVKPDDIRTGIHKSAQIIEPVAIASGATIGAGCRIGPDVAVGEGCRIDEGAVVRRSMLWPDSVVGAGAHVNDTIVASEASVPAHTHHSGEVIVPSDA